MALSTSNQTISQKIGMNNFKHWFNKNFQSLEKEYGEIEDHNKFMIFCNNKYNEKTKKTNE